jgi:hypothetical protein
MSDIIDEQDFSKLMAAIIRQAIDDYVKLQHPKYRRKKYLVEAYQQAIDMFFDHTYKFLSIPNDYGEDMSLMDMLKAALKTEHVDIEKLREHAIAEAVAFWDTKAIKTVEIPDSLQINGHVYDIRHEDSSTSYVIDFDNKILTLDKLMNTTSDHEDIPIKPKHMAQLAKGWFRTLKLNNCFTGAD